MSALAPSLVRPQIRSVRLVADVALVLGGSLLIAGLAQLVIPLPFTPVPITGQTMGILLVGASLGWGRGTLATGLYLIQASILGLPFFAGGASGIDPLRLTAATGGYLWGFLVAASLVGWLANRGWDRNLRTSFGMMVVGNVVIYAFGVLWLANALDVSLVKGLELGLVPFLIGDAIKIAIASLSLPLVWRLRDRIGSTRTENREV